MDCIILTFGPITDVNTSTAAGSRARSRIGGTARSGADAAPSVLEDPGVRRIARMLWD
ncbi:MAG TPA: hypothetical protein VGR06_09265 [Actinophytocola sp.]|uniref:hypothetical protein n=1 Tax=Actinophytocola sp. TaxID=1872138 RepID=UPI002E07C652|nr:hypothetical protein [Actinophytocola sp.]